MMGPGGLRSGAAEIAMLRHQLQILQRRNKRAPRLTATDRFVLAFTSFFITKRRLPRLAIILKPATLLSFHRALVRGKYKILFGRRTRGKPGPKGPSKELINFVISLKEMNPRFGSGKIACMASRALGFDIDDDTVRRILKKHYKPPTGEGPSWLTFIGNTADGLWSLDLFRCESVLLRSHWVMIVMDQFSRKIIGFAICAGSLDEAAICRMLNRASAGKIMPKYLSTDNDPIFYSHQWGANLRVLGIEEIKSVPHAPVSHPFIERLIGTVRREYLDHTLFWGELDLQHKLKTFATYYNQHRVHSAVPRGMTPLEKSLGQSLPSPIDLKKYTWQSHCRGLFRTPVAA